MLMHARHLLPAQEKERTAARKRELEKELERAQREREAKEREAQQASAASTSVTYMLIRVYTRLYAHTLIYARHPLPGKRGECGCHCGKR